MSKPALRPYSEYSLNALAFLGQLVREARIGKSMTAVDLAARAGISRSLLHRIERGDPSCSIGAVFEAAAICGVPLFEADQRLMAQQLARQTDKMVLLPKAVRPNLKAVSDDF